MQRRPYATGIIGLVIIVLVIISTVPQQILSRPDVGVADFEPPAGIAQAPRAPVLFPARLSDGLALPAVNTVYVSSTGFHISDRAGFLGFWLEHGGERIFGLPISGEVVEEGLLVQYFERARFEYHVDAATGAGQVLLTLLGSQLTLGRDFPDGAPAKGAVYFDLTRHTLRGKFLRFWEKFGGLAIFGYPISEPFQEISPIDGTVRLTQYFERARMEWIPEAMPPYYQERERANGILLAALGEIRLTDYGRLALRDSSVVAQRQAALPDAFDWIDGPRERRIEIDLTQQRLTAYENDLPVYHAPVATGKDGFNTPVGTFEIYHRTPMQDMRGSAGGESWYVPRIPWVQFIHGGVALHGTYWHDRWGTGTRMSHGCINLNLDDAQWLYEWASLRTPVIVHY
ncbi:MAG: L,D-transpeptidase [Chloroflexi bacterium]|nr:L,D-transpeptidase [Chloroflexota bacterium]